MYKNNKYFILLLIMFNNFNKKFITLSKSINCFLNNKQLEYNFKIRNTTLIDGCLFKLLSSEINSTHEKTTLKINQYNNKNISRIAYYKRSEQLDINFYKNLSEHISNKINSLFYKNNNQKIILAVDGTYSQFKTSISNNNLNKNNDSVTNLITGIYNLSYNTPELMQIEEKKSERKSLLNIIKNKYTNKSHIFVMDRGYFGFDLFNEINKTNNFFICRIRSNLDIINNNNKLNDYNVKINLSNLKTIRIIKYNINNNYYYLATNLENDINFNYESLINIYHRRWTIEEFFKLVKNSTNLKFNNEEDYIRINKSIYCYEIITKIMYLIKNYHESKIINKYVSNTKIKIVNKCFLMNYIFNYNFLFHFFNGTINNEYLNYQLIKGINIIYSNINRSNSRQCKRSNYLFYFKNKKINKSIIENKNIVENKKSIINENINEKQNFIIDFTDY